MNYQSICSHTALIARETGLFVKQNRLLQDPDIQVKGKNDFVTNMDKQSEAMIVERLSELLPEAGFITEEGTKTDQMPVFNWIVDPIDGTTNFIHNLYPYAISIALKEHERIVVGVVYEMGRDECFYAWAEGGAWLNERRIKVSDAPSVAQSLISTGFPYNNFSLMEGYLKSLQHLMQNCNGIRRPGSAATDLAYVACGRFDGFYEYSLKAHDVAAGILLVSEAGGCISDFKGGSNYLFGGEIIASNKLISNEFQSIIINAFHE